MYFLSLRVVPAGSTSSCCCSLSSDREELSASSQLLEKQQEFSSCTSSGLRYWRYCSLVNSLAVFGSALGFLLDLLGFWSAWRGAMRRWSLEWCLGFLVLRLPRGKLASLCGFLRWSWWLFCDFLALVSWQACSSSMFWLSCLSERGFWLLWLRTSSMSCVDFSMPSVMNFSFFVFCSFLGCPFSVLLCGWTTLTVMRKLPLWSSQLKAAGVLSSLAGMRLVRLAATRLPFIYYPPCIDLLYPHITHTRSPSHAPLLRTPSNPAVMIGNADHLTSSFISRYPFCSAFGVRISPSFLSLAGLLEVKLASQKSTFSCFLDLRYQTKPATPAMATMSTTAMAMAELWLLPDQLSICASQTGLVLQQQEKACALAWTLAVPVRLNLGGSSAGSKLSCTSWPAVASSSREEKAKLADLLRTAGWVCCLRKGEPALLKLQLGHRARMLAGEDSEELGAAEVVSITQRVQVRLMLFWLPASVRLASSGSEMTILPVLSQAISTISLLLRSQAEVSSRLSWPMLLSLREQAPLRTCWFLTPRKKCPFWMLSLAKRESLFLWQSVRSEQVPVMQSEKQLVPVRVLSLSASGSQRVSSNITFWLTPSSISWKLSSAIGRYLMAVSPATRCLMTGLLTSRQYSLLRAERFGVEKHIVQVSPAMKVISRRQAWAAAANLAMEGRIRASTLSSFVLLRQILQSRSMQLQFWYLPASSTKSTMSFSRPNQTGAWQLQQFCVSGLVKESQRTTLQQIQEMYWLLSLKRTEYSRGTLSMFLTVTPYDTTWFSTLLSEMARTRVSELTVVVEKGAAPSDSLTLSSSLPKGLSTCRLMSLRERTRKDFLAPGWREWVKVVSRASAVVSAFSTMSRTEGLAVTTFMEQTRWYFCCETARVLELQELKALASKVGTTIGSSLFRIGLARIALMLQADSGSAVMVKPGVPSKLNSRVTISSPAAVSRVQYLLGQMARWTELVRATVQTHGPLESSEMLMAQVGLLQMIGPQRYQLVELGSTTTGRQAESASMSSLTASTAVAGSVYWRRLTLRESLKGRGELICSWVTGFLLEEAVAHPLFINLALPGTSMLRYSVTAAKQTVEPREQPSRLSSLPAIDSTKMFLKGSSQQQVFWPRARAVKLMLLMLSSCESSATIEQEAAMAAPSARTTRSLMSSADLMGRRRLLGSWLGGKGTAESLRQVIYDYSRYTLRDPPKSRVALSWSTQGQASQASCSASFTLAWEALSAR